MADERKEFWQDMFILFDKECKKQIPTKKIYKYLYSVGVIYDKRDVSKKIESADTEGSGYLNFDKIWDTFNELPDVTDEEIKNAFKVFDKGGKLQKEELKYVLTNLGDKVKEEEADKIISKLGKCDDNDIDYKEFLKKYGFNID